MRQIKSVLFNTVLAVFSFLSFQNTGLAQRKYGNEWISYGQTYYKLKVVQNGIYRISYNDLQTAGMNVSGIDPTHLQMFFRGSEIPIYVSSGTKTSFGAGDYIEFYGQGNDGALDSVLYLNPKDDINKSYSMYTDTAAYFLTVGSLTSKMRYSVSAKQYGNNPQSLYTCEQDLNLHDGYYNGVPVDATLNFYGSDYNAGAGWMGSAITCTSYGSPKAVIYTINLNSSYTPSDTLGLPKPQLEILVYGKSDVSGQSPDHHLVIAAYPTYATIWDTTYDGFKTIHKTITRYWSDVAGKSTVNYIVEAAGVQPAPGSVTSDEEVVSFLRMHYLNSFGIDPNNPFLTFNIKNNSGSSQTDFNFTAAAAPASARNLVLYDLTNHIRTKSFLMTDQNASFAIDNDGDSTSYVLYDTTQALKALSINPVNFVRPDYSQNYNYIIVTNKMFASGAQSFANYKATQEIDSSGNKFNPLIVYCDDLYDQFFYGVHHPAAIQNFMANLYNSASQKPQYLLLLGKGIDNADERNYFNDDYVPGIGYPPADVMFTAGIDIGFQGKDKVIDPKMGIGRLQILKNSDVLAYLNKLQQYDISIKNEPSYLKTAINVDGGDNNQITEIRNFMDAEAGVLSRPYTGLKVKSYYSTANTAINGSLQSVIQKNIEQGTGLFTYLAHGAAEQLQVNFTDTTTLRNNGRYPIMYLNGCNLGDAFLPPNQSSYGGFFTLAPNKGSVIWLSHSNEALDNVLYTEMTAFFKNVTVGNYGKSVGSTWRKTITDLKSYDSNGYYRPLLYEWMLQGDPSLRFPYISKPDYAVYDSALFVTPPDVVATAASYRVGIPVVNLGKAISATVKVELKQTLPDHSVHTFDTVMPPVSYIDTLYFTINRNGLNIQGINKFDVYVNPDSAIDETSYANNHATFSFYFGGNSVRALFPIDFGIVNTDTPALVSQSRNLEDYKTGIYFEIDTTSRFNSPLKQVSPLLKGSSLITWRPKLNNVDKSGNQVDSTVYYWRTRMNLPADSGGEWSIQSFIYLTNGRPGWSQSNWGQYGNIQGDLLIVDTSTRKIRFLNDSLGITLAANAYSKGGIQPQNELNLTPCTVNTTTLLYIEYDRKTLKPIGINRQTGQPLFIPGNCFGTINTPNFYQQFDMSQPSQRDSFERAIALVPQGNYILLISEAEGIHNSEYISQFDTTLLKTFESFGDTLVRQLKASGVDSVGIVIAGIKGNPKGTLLAEQSVARPNINNAKIKPRLAGIAADSGSIISEQIGPASKWHTMYQDYRSPFYPKVYQASMSVHGITPNGSDTILYHSIKTDSFDVSNINAQQYPYLKLQAFLADTANIAPPQLRLWQVEYDGIPEGTIIADSESVYPKTSYSAGDSIHVRIKFQNISSWPMTKVLVTLTIKNGLYNTISVDSTFYKPLQPGEFFWIDTTLPTKNLSGTNYLVVFVNPGFQQPEQTLDNNFIQFKFTIGSDQVNPLMDVTFDGAHITDGQIVSPDPDILVSVRDENRLQPLNDTADYQLSLQYPDSQRAQNIYFSNPKIKFMAGDSADNNAIINYHPGPLTDGMYLFKAQATDISGNLSGPTPYSIHFKVINQPAISNFYLYPNPLTDVSHFGFTLTGSEIPQTVEIRIFDITGKCVRTLSAGGSGNLRAGVNEISWDGTDAGGAVLNQGMYIYKVIVKLNGNQPQNYPLPVDGQLKEGYGKIVILRN